MKRQKGTETPWERSQKKQKKQLRPKKFLSLFNHLKLPTSKKKSPQRKRPDKSIFKIGIVVLGIVLVGIIVYVLTPFSRVQKITVIGNKRVADNLVIKSSHIKKNDLVPLIIPNSGKIEKQVKHNNSDLSSVDLKIKNGNKIVITVKENAVLAYVIRNGKYYTVRQDGTVVRTSTTQPTGNYPVLYGFNNNKILKSFLTKYAEISNLVQDNVSDVILKPTKLEPDRIIMNMDDGNQIIAIISTMNKKIKYYPEIAASMKKKGVVNFEVGAYSYPFSVASEETESNTSSKPMANSTSVKKKASKKNSSNDLKTSE